jgi:hypothetical protein
VQRLHLHQRVRARLEAGYDPQVGEIATQLAVHCERGGAVQRAVHYLQQAGEHAARRNAPHEAIAALTKGLALLTTLPDSAERTQCELTLHLSLGELLLAVQGLASPEGREVYTRAQELCQQVEETPQRLRALLGLVQFHIAQAQLGTAGELS